MPNVLTQEVKDLYIARAIKHEEADAFIQGTYWDGHKGCCVGCLAETAYNPHQKLAKDLNVPRWIFQLADTIHESLPYPDFKDWPLRFMQAMPVGLDKKAWHVQVKVPFLLIVLDKALASFDHEKFPECKEAIEKVIGLYESGETDESKFKAAGAASRAAARRSAYAARDAGSALAYYATAAGAAYAAAGDAAYAAAAGDAAYAAARAARDAASRAADESWKYFTDALIQLMENANDAQQND